jgi:hypothetical protein
LDDLADLWMSAPDRQRIADAANEIDRILADRPVAQGIELHEGLMQPAGMKAASIAVLIALTVILLLTVIAAVALGEP